MSKKEFIKNYKKSKELKKSYDYSDAHIRVDSREHADAENANPEFVKQLKETFLKSDRYAVESLPVGEGLLVLSQTDNNLFNGFFKDIQGQVTEKFTNKTIEMVAKALLVKSLVILPEPPAPAPKPEISMMGGYVKLKFGDFEFEMKKSMTNDFPRVNRKDLHKAVRIWKKSSEPYTGVTNLKDSLKELSENWELHQEKFNQILFGIQKSKK